MTSCLVIDCSGQKISVALAHRDHDTTVWSETLDQKHGQAEALAPLANRVFQQSTLTEWSDLGHIVVCRGPGGFTGLRIGVAFALGLGAGLQQTKLWGITTDAYWVSQLNDRQDGFEGPMVCVVDTRRDDFYWKDLRLHASDWAIAPSVDALPACYDKATLFGNASLASRSAVGTGHRFEEIDVGHVAQMSLDPTFRSVFLTSETSPLYVRAPAISKAKQAS